MAHEDTGWRPKGGVEPYRGYDVWEYEIGPHEVNDGEVDGDISFEGNETDTEESEADE
ncbi:hypothetical protein SAMN04487950_1291 [Halogranum rubrum]|uniref:Uncharacterized protein n=1 Tax=Halogranum rubrum TaxID=553466 RepID=A0A1I4CMW5_9EURY|nr:hypothetical protein [Halogranum rubrum]SFK82614.1 hypothetical protein SAMN04487950_1291 [Halogranum rubrum]